MMARIRGRDTGPELALRKSLHRMGFRYRIHGGDLPGRPDLVFPKYHAVVFVHGCFWHRHEGCPYSTTPSSNVEFWRDKFDKSIARDARNIARLRQTGWRFAIVWECAMRKKAQDSVASLVGEWLKSEAFELEIPTNTLRADHP